MSFPESVRPLVTTVLVATYLPVPIYLLWMHTLQRVWRRVGLASYIVHLSLYAALVTLVARSHAAWSWNAWPWPAALSWIAAVPLILAAWLAIYTYATIDFKTLHQIRQLVPGKERRIVRSGVLGRMRHPRYVMFSLIGIGAALFSGYPLVAVTAVLTVALFAVVILVEERELAQCFGEEFERYRREVPAFIPRLRRP